MVIDSVVQMDSSTHRSESVFEVGSAVVVVVHGGLMVAAEVVVVQIGADFASMLMATIRIGGSEVYRLHHRLKARQCRCFQPVLGTM